MYRSALALLAVVSLVLQASPTAQTPPLRIFRDYIESLRAQAGIPGLAVALVGPDGIFFEHASGRQDLARALPARTDTPFHADGLTQVLTATLVLRCAEEGRLSLDEPVGRFENDNPEPNVTIRQVLSHTSGSTAAPVFTFRPDRWEVLTRVVRACMVNSYRESLANLLDQFAMRDSVPGPDILSLRPPAEGIPSEDEVNQYRLVLARLATSYSVDVLRRATPIAPAATTLTPASGLIASVLDLASFDRALRSGQLLRPATLTQAWTPRTAGDGTPLPHGLGWFSQMHNGERIVWQFGGGLNGSSSLWVTVPSRNYSFIVMANSAGLFKTPPLTVNDLVASPFVRVLLGFSAA